MRISRLATLISLLVTSVVVHAKLGVNSTAPVHYRHLSVDSRIRRGPNNNGRPRFRKGEIIIKGSPLTLPAGIKVVKYLPKADVTVVKVTSGREQEIVEKLRAKGKEAEENFEMHASSGTFPNDLYFSPYQWHFDKVQAKQAWELTDHKAGNGVIVAVLDTGLHIGGVDGIGCVKTNLQRNTNRDNYNVDDVDGHGTHVAGTIAQTTNNGEGVAGLAFGACIMPVKVLGDDGSGSFGDIAEGIYWAVDNGANVINMSLGVDASSGMRSDSVVDRALQYAYSKGVTVVAASGNDSYGKNVAYPSIYPTVLSVGATGFSNKRAYYSNYGEGLDIVAPGGDTSVDANGDGYADGVLQETIQGGGMSYLFFQGTSMATLHVAAAAAIVIGHRGKTSPDEMKKILTSSAKYLGSRAEYGAGLLQVHDALVYASTSNNNNPPPPPTEQPRQEPTCLARRKRCDLGRGKCCSGVCKSNRRRTKKRCK